MGAAFFYQLTGTPLETTLPMLLCKARGNGWRVAVRGVDAARMARLDALLWDGPPDGFVPHGMAGGPHDPDQPILLSVGPTTANNPVCVISVDGADVAPDEVAALERVCILFEGADDAALQRARGQWKALTDAGCAAQYWAQDDAGHWVKKAEKGGVDG